MVSTGIAQLAIMRNVFNSAPCQLLYDPVVRYVSQPWFVPLLRRGALFALPFPEAPPPVATLKEPSTSQSSDDKRPCKRRQPMAKVLHEVLKGKQHSQYLFG